MKLYLSSIGVPNSVELLALLGSIPAPTVAIIPNAYDAEPLDNRSLAIDQTEALFRNLGFSSVVLDVRQNHGPHLLAEIVPHNLLWVMGGNTFVLNEAVRRAGLQFIFETMANRGIVFGGESAGAVLAGKTLHGIEHLDDANQATEVIWDGLGLIEASILPHWGSAEYAAGLEPCRLEMLKTGEVITLTNDQALVSDGVNTRVIART